MRSYLNRDLGAVTCCRVHGSAVREHVIEYCAGISRVDLEGDRVTNIGYSSAFLCDVYEVCARRVRAIEAYVLTNNITARVVACRSEPGTCAIARDDIIRNSDSVFGRNGLFSRGFGVVFTTKRNPDLNVGIDWSALRVFRYNHNFERKPRLKEV